MRISQEEEERTLHGEITPAEFREQVLAKLVNEENLRKPNTTKPRMQPLCSCVTSDVFQSMSFNPKKNPNDLQSQEGD